MTLITAGSVGAAAVLLVHVPLSSIQSAGFVTCDICVFNDNYQLIHTIEFQEHYFLYDPNQAYLSSIRCIPIQDKYFLVPQSDDSISIYDLRCKVVKTFGRSGVTADCLYKPRCAAVTLSGEVVVVGDNNMMQFF